MTGNSVRIPDLGATRCECLLSRCTSINGGYGVDNLEDM
jgi:hypothetical protein